MFVSYHESTSNALDKSAPLSSESCATCRVTRAAPVPNATQTFHPVPQDHRGNNFDVKFGRTKFLSMSVLIRRPTDHVVSGAGAGSGCPRGKRSSRDLPTVSGPRQSPEVSCTRFLHSQHPLGDHVAFCASQICNLAVFGNLSIVKQDKTQTHLRKSFSDETKH